MNELLTRLTPESAEERTRLGMDFVQEYVTIDRYRITGEGPVFDEAVATALNVALDNWETTSLPDAYLEYDAESLPISDDTFDYLVTVLFVDEFTDPNFERPLRTVRFWTSGRTEF